jgi:hypothetical protein
VAPAGASGGGSRNGRESLCRYMGPVDSAADVIHALCGAALAPASAASCDHGQPSIQLWAAVEASVAKAFTLLAIASTDLVGPILDPF